MKQVRDIFNTKSKDNICTNCGKPIGKLGIASPTLDKKRRNQCLTCAEEMLSMESKKVTIIKRKKEKHV